MKTVVFVLAISMAIGLIGCDQSKSGASGKTASGSAAAPADAAALMAVVLAAEPPGARPLGDVKRDAKEGEEVVVVGRVGGTKDPFVAGRAIMTLADLKLPPCNVNPEDTCPTPWDYCCEPADNLIAHTLTVQVVDHAGKPLKGDLRGLAGIKPLSDVVVRGKMVTSAVTKSTVLNATGIFVKRP